MVDQGRVPRPRGLGLEGARLWRAVLGGYELRVDEHVVLEAACRTLDVVTRLDAAMLGEPLVVKGSMGQEREHPLLSEGRQQRAALARLLRQLDLPEEATAAVGVRSAAARELARARWSH